MAQINPQFIYAIIHRISTFLPWPWLAVVSPGAVNLLLSYTWALSVQSVFFTSGWMVTVAISNREYFKWRAVMRRSRPYGGHVSRYWYSIITVNGSTLAQLIGVSGLSRWVTLNSVCSRRSTAVLIWPQRYDWAGDQWNGSDKTSTSSHYMPNWVLDLVLSWGTEFST